MVFCRCCESNCGDGPTEVAGASEDIIMEKGVCTWEARVEKGSYGKLGMEIAPEDNVLLVQSLHQEGAVVTFNAANPKQALHAGDYIIAVNNVRGLAQAMLNEAKDVQSLTLTVSRARSHIVAVTKSGALGVTFGVFKRVLVVQEVKDGPIKDWNTKNSKKKIRPGDQILKVNGISDTPQTILETLKEDGDLKIEVLPLGGAGSGLGEADP
mmetsp:Transcript_102359/g.285194  ORF Transcript_102359/g.285194 Transcript_102359/m.285194 type:complete len:211 (+) Transcript_102359:109-741(+)